MKRKIRMGMVGGGPGAFIGAVHRIAARLDGEIELVSGVFGRDPAKSRACAEELYLDPARGYADYQSMIKAELALPADQRIDFVAICTPNQFHFPVKCRVKLFLSVQKRVCRILQYHRYAKPQHPFAPCQTQCKNVQLF